MNAPAAKEPARRKLADRVEDTLLALIHERQLRPGDVLPSERQLMAQLGLGRPAIREAMQRLRQMGLIHISQGERPRMAEPSIEALAAQTAQAMRHLLLNSAVTLTHLKEARTAFESMLAGQAAEHATAADLAALEAVLAAQAEVRSDAAQFRAADGVFHARLAALSGNPIYTSLAQALFDWLSEFHVDQVSRPGLEDLTLAEHRNILDAVTAGDAVAARAAMTAHLTRANALYHQVHAGR